MGGVASQAASGEKALGTRDGKLGHTFGGILRVSKQIRPLVSMFGWKMGVTKRTLGGSKGYLHQHLLVGTQRTPGRQHHIPVRDSNYQSEETALIRAIWRTVKLCTGVGCKRGSHFLDRVCISYQQSES